MKLTPPKVVTFWVAVVLGVLGFLGQLSPSISIIGDPYSFWFVFVGFVLLVLGLLVKGL